MYREVKFSLVSIILIFFQGFFLLELWDRHVFPCQLSVDLCVDWSSIGNGLEDWSRIKDWEQMGG